jgi:glucokinase
MILAGDIGGTNTRLAVFDDRLKMVGRVHKFKTQGELSLEEHIEKVLHAARRDAPKRACLAIAGPVIDGICRPVNISRTFSADEMRKATGLESLIMINDLVANAAGIESLDRNETVTVLKGEKHFGNCAIVSPGTGLGEGALIWDGAHHRPIPSEGGHARFAPTSALEQDFLTFMLRSHKTVSFEHVCSGKGIEPLLRFFVERGSDVSAKFMKRFEREKPGSARAAMITDAALDHSEKAAVDAMELFVRVLAIEASNMAFKVFATGGVYLGGGIPPRILPMIKSKVFKDAFLSHAVLGGLLKRFPVKVILNTDTALEGAAIYCSRFDA